MATILNNYSNNNKIVLQHFIIFNFFVRFLQNNNKKGTVPHYRYYV